MKNKKGLVEENIIFLLVTIVFFVALLLFISFASNRTSFYEQEYSKKISLLIDEAKPDMTIYLDISELLEKNQLENGQDMVRIDESSNKVVVKLSEGKGYGFTYFTDVKVELDYEENNLLIKIREKNAI